MHRRQFLTGLAAAAPFAVWPRLDYGKDNLVTPQTFGARGNGIADDTAALQKWLDVKGELYLPPGVYRVVGTSRSGAALRIRGAANISGERGKSVIQLADGQAPQAVIGLDRGVSDVSLSNIVVDGNRDRQPGFSASYMGIRGGAGNARIQYRQLEIRNVFGRSLETNGDGQLSDGEAGFARDILIEGIVIRGSGTKSCHVRRSRNVTVRQCAVVTSGVPDDNRTNKDNPSAFEASGSEDVTFEDCKADHTVHGWGVSLRAVNGAHSIVFRRCEGRRGRQGVAIVDASDVVVDECRLADNGNVGIEVQSVGNDRAWMQVRNIYIRRNTIINPTKYGLEVSCPSPGISVENLQVLDNTFYGGANRMLYGLRNAGTGRVIAYAARNQIVDAIRAARSGQWIDM